MRLWHEELIPNLPRQQLLGQHRECCALRGLGWKKPHKTINYIFDYNPIFLFFYHELIMKEMENRGYNVTEKWKDLYYRGFRSDSWDNEIDLSIEKQKPVYKEHDSMYLNECILNLKEKGIQIST